MKNKQKHELMSHLAAFMPVTFLLLLAMVAWSTNSVLSPLAHAQADIIPDKSGDNVALADNVPPSDVDNVKATAGDGSVTLTWNVATDNVGVKGYKVYYGTSALTPDSEGYALGPVDVGKKINYTVTGLNNGSIYYFAVTSYDEADNESVNYSIEVSATPMHGAASDSQAPKVVKAVSADKLTVKVIFSEAVKLPDADKHPETAFSIKMDGAGTALDVKNAIMDANDKENKTVLLTTAKQKAGANYILTAGIQLKDLAGNPIVSGTSDTAPFLGTDLEPLTQQSTQQTIQSQQTQSKKDPGPALLNVTVPDSTHVQITFSKPVVISQKPGDNFIITEEVDTEKILKVLKADQSNDGAVVILTTASQEAMNYNLIVIDVTDKDGNAINSETNATTFAGAVTLDTQQVTQQSLPTQQAAQSDEVAKALAAAALFSDTSAPEDVTNLLASALRKMVIRLSFVPSLNTAKDLANYIVYKSTDGQNYGEGVVFKPDSKLFDMKNLLPGVQYFFKVTAKDIKGNESMGAMTTFTLPETGPELILLALGSLGAGKLLKRRKK